MRFVSRWAPLVFLTLARPLAALPNEPLRDFDAYVTRAVKDWRVPGLAIIVVKNDQVVFRKGYGVRELGKPGPVDASTLFAIGSTTKAMTAAAIGMLVDEKKLRWNDPVIQHLPGFQLYDPYVTREITVRDLLTHRAGLGNADFLWYRVDNSPAEILRRLRFVKPETSLRSHFTYQNLMYQAAGEVIAAASGMPWERFVRERIFDPLGMASTIPTARTLKERPNVASPHEEVDGALKVIGNASVDAVAAAGAVWSSVDDMSRWMRFLLNGGKVGERALLSEATVKELFTPQVIVGPEGFYPTARLTSPHWTTYGLGWFQQDYRGRAVDFHTGSIDGMVAIHGLIRDERLGVYVLSNLDHAELRHALMLRVFDLYGESPARDWSAELLKLYSDLKEEAEVRRKKRDEERVAGTRPSLAIEKYASTYQDQLYGSVVVSYDGALRLSRGPTLTAALEHWHYDTFRVRWDLDWLGETLVTFRLDEKGAATSLQIDGATLSRVEAK